MNQTLVSNIIAAGKAAALALEGGGGTISAVVATADAVLRLADDAREAASATPELIAEYDRTRDALEKAVNDHADRTAAALKG